MRTTGPRFARLFTVGIEDSRAEVGEPIIEPCRAS